MTKPNLEDLKAKAEELIEIDDDLIYDTAAEVGQIVGNVKHMHWFKLAVMRAITENTDEFAHLIDDLAEETAPTMGRPSPSMTM